jgi:hypothetical protein
MLVPEGMRKMCAVDVYYASICHLCSAKPTKLRQRQAIRGWQGLTGFLPCMVVEDYDDSQ